MTADPPTPLPRLLRKIGEGGMGEVWLAEHPSRGRIAVKRLLPEFARGDLLERFRAEFATLARMRHPNLIEVYEEFVEPESGLNAYAMELIEGLDFTAATGGLAPEEIAGLAEQVCEALEHVHSRDLVHGDVKPGNLIVRRGHVTLMDFGLARRPGPSGRRGSIEYLAPEVIQGRPHDRRADLYSLGVVMFESLTRHPPFHAPTRFGVLRAHLRSRPEFPQRIRETVPEALRRVVERLLCKDPSARFFTAAETAEALRAARGARGRRFLPPESLGRPGCVGRAGVLEALDAEVRRAGTSGAPTILLVSGPPGSGKAAVLREFQRRLTARGIAAPAATCDREAPAFEPVRAWLRALAAHASPEWPLLRAALASLDAGTPDAASLAADALAAVACRAPVALLIRGAEEADPGTVAMVEGLALRRHARVAVVGSITAGECTAPWPEAKVLQLGPLDRSGIADLAAASTGAAGVSPAFAEALLKASGGFPGPARACLRTLAAEGALFLDDHLLDSAAPPGAAPGLERVLESLTTDARMGAEALAAWGRAASEAVVSKIAGLALDRAAAALYELERRGLAVREPGGVRLAAPALAAAVAAATPPATFAAIHAACAELPDATIEDAAHHLFHAGGGARAVAAALAAAARLAPAAPLAATRLLRRALADPASGPSESRAARALLADALDRLGERAEAAAIFLQLAESDPRDAFLLRAAAATPDPAAALELSSTLGDSDDVRHLRARALHAQGRLQASLAACPPRLPSSVRATTLLALERSEEAAAEAFAAAEALEGAGRLAEAAEAAGTAAEALAAARDLPGALRAHARAERLAERSGAPAAHLGALVAEARTLEMRAETPAALAAWKRAVRLARSHRAGRALACAGTGAAALLLQHDRLGEALELAEEGTRAAGAAVHETSRAFAELARILSRLGAHAEAEQAASRAVNLLDAEPSSPPAARARSARAAVLLAAGHVARAREDHAAARAAWPAAADPLFDLEASLASGDADAVLALAPTLAPACPRDAVRLSAARARALLASGMTVGWSAAVDEAYDLLGQARAFGSPAWTRRAHQILGVATLALGLTRTAQDHLRLALDLLRDSLTQVPTPLQDGFLALPENVELRSAILRLGS